MNERKRERGRPGQQEGGEREEERGEAKENGRSKQVEAVEQGRASVSTVHLVHSCSLPCRAAPHRTARPERSRETEREGERERSEKRDSDDAQMLEEEQGVAWYPRGQENEGSV